MGTREGPDQHHQLRDSLTRQKPVTGRPLALGGWQIGGGGRINEVKHDSGLLLISKETSLQGASVTDSSPRDIRQWRRS